MQVAATITRQEGAARSPTGQQCIDRTQQESDARELTGSQIMCEMLVREGVELLWGYPGGAIMPFYDALTSYPILHHVLTRHEQGAAHAADGFARATGKVGVCVATSGPGATNLVTGLATAYMDSTPIVAITGQVARPFIGRDAFQETDVLGLTQPITKHNFLVQRVEDLAEIMHEAFRLARDGRPGPVLIDVPKDIQFARTMFHPAVPVDNFRAQAPTQPLTTAIIQAAQLIAEAQRPLIMAGHGVIFAKAYDELRAFAEKTNMPVITTLLGLSAFPETHPLSIGMPGMHGPAHVNRAIGEADVIVGVGLRFDDRVTGKVSEFAPHARIIHIDIDPSEMHKVKRAAVPIVADAKAALAALVEVVQPGDHTDWIAVLRGWEAQDQERIASIPRGKDSAAAPDPITILQTIRAETRGEAMIVSDVGQHQMWTARHYTYTRPNSHITSGGLGTMGFALPAAMGVKMGTPDSIVWAIVGDGGIQMNIQELATLRQEGVTIKVAIMNNGYLGMVRQWQQFFHNRNYSETPITGPDYVKLAAAYGLKGICVRRREDIAEAVHEAMETEGSVIIDFVIESESNVYPMVAPGSAITNMIEEKAE